MKSGGGGEKSSKNQNSKSDSKFQTKTDSKFKMRKIAGPRKIAQKIFVNFKNKNLHKSPSFWIVNIFFVFFTIKMIQFALYANEFTIMLPKEEAMNYMMYFDKGMLSKMKPEVLHKYLDELEKKKEERIRERENAINKLSAVKNNFEELKENKKL